MKYYHNITGKISFPTAFHFNSIQTMGMANTPVKIFQIKTSTPPMNRCSFGGNERQS